MHTEWLLRIDRRLGGLLLLFCRRWRRRTLPTAVRTILVFKFMGGGSITVAGPLLLALRRRHPGARLVLVCTSQVAPHAELLGLFDRIEAVEDRGVFRLALSLASILYRCRRMRPELSVNLEVYSRVAVFCGALAGGQFRSGFYLEEETPVRGCYDMALPFARRGRVYEYYDALAGKLESPLPEPEELRERICSEVPVPTVGGAAAGGCAVLQCVELSPSVGFSLLGGISYRISDCASGVAGAGDRRSEGCRARPGDPCRGAAKAGGADLFRLRQALSAGVGGGDSWFGPFCRY